MSCAVTFVLLLYSFLFFVFTITLFWQLLFVPYPSRVTSIPS
eukprot:COSAG01_NODE_7791_length_3055_cov_4.866373_4_plen_42_part_00